MDGRKCPKCGKTYTDYPAISRDDNITEICPDFGVLESLQAIGVPEREWEPILDIIHSWERRKKFHVVQRKR